MPSKPLLSQHPELSAVRVYMIGLALGCSTGVDFWASAMMGVAGTHIRGGVHASPEDFLWTLTSYAAAAVVANLMLRRLAHDISYRGFTMAGLVIAAAGAALCALSRNPLELALARAVQGFGAGGLFAASRIIIQLAAAREERRPLFIGFNIGSMGLPAAAPWITAQLVENAEWQMVFVLQAGIALATLLFVVLTYPPRLTVTLAPWHVDYHAMDWVTVILFGAGALTLLHGLGDLRFYELANSPSVAFTPMAGIALFAAGMVYLRRHPDPWLNPKLLLGRRFLIGLSFYAIYYLLNGLWTYVISTMLQNGMGFTFQTTGTVLTTTSLLGFAAAAAFTFWGTSLPGSRRYIALGYLIFAMAAWLLSQRMMPGASLEVILPVLVLQNLTLPFVLMLVAGLTWAEFSVDDFAHGYQFKNIVRQIASAAGTGLASLWLQYDEAIARTQLVAHVTPFEFQQGIDPAELARLSRLIDQQATLIGTANLLMLLAGACCVIAIVAVSQRALK
ncbi:MULTISPECIES: MFS transporter [Cupriavidus]|jgi:MFS family permease|uniref:MFS transporter n=1 Tax=Cupriavidus metallidurans TaxID=119219 RepID=A0A482IZU6_9BURK|nr:MULTISPECIES: MFS transporter [Cupriavidus]KWR81607.1 multidrug resistance protein [Cupriavidus sp. SHE]QBP12927.1 MFS transporter [Cupriavidus metallidurans]QWC90718.1 MFS transporter [Cupriavidus metallidurans]